MAELAAPRLSPGRDFLTPYLRERPTFLALLRALEAHLYQGIPLARPALDVGCGDGFFAAVAFADPFDVGLDPAGGALREAAHRGAHRAVVQATGGRMPFADAAFASAISNSVLEHVADVEAALGEVGRVLHPDGRFLFTVPNHRFDPALSLARALDRVGLARLGSAYRGFFDRISRHRHLDPPPVWERRLRGAGLEVEAHWSYFPPSALRALEWGHYLDGPSLVTRALLGRWNVVRSAWNLAPAALYARRHQVEPLVRDDGTCTFFVARRTRASRLT